MTYLSRKHFWVFFITLLLFWPQIALASESPKLLNPPDNSSESKPKLTWQYSGECIQSGSCFRVEVDNNSDFNSPEKSAYTNSFSYSPQGLPDGTYHWHVKAKDKSDAWSDWSPVFKFTIGNQTSPSPSTQEVATPSPASTPQSTSKK